MRLPPFNILEPGTKKSALSILENHRKELKIIAGGIEVVVMMKLGLSAPLYLMSLKKIKGLRGIKKRNNEVIIGSSTTIKEILQSPLINDNFKCIAQAAQLLAAPPIQNKATIGGNILQNTRCLYYNQSELFRNGLKPCFKGGGNICHAVKGGKHCSSVYQGDMAPSLISFGSMVKLEKKDSSRTVLLLDLFTGKGESPFSIQDNELLTQIIIPLPDENYGSSYEKLRIRKGLEYPLVSAAVFLSEDNDGNLDNARIVIGAAASAPKIIENASSYMNRRNLSTECIDKVVNLADNLSKMVNNLSVPAVYRRKMVKVVIKRSLQNAFQDLKKGA
ncbi:MAG: FAD binding domain-containing protein [Proteobacteria bacterium]|nr:FAD binding domain-containing protein [Pseudomonadota bacterium]